jgi:hypothetical protein
VFSARSINRRINSIIYESCRQGKPRMRKDPRERGRYTHPLHQPNYQ